MGSYDIKVEGGDSGLRHLKLRIVSCILFPELRFRFRLWVKVLRFNFDFGLIVSVYNVLRQQSHNQRWKRESYFAEQENFANKYIGFTVGSIIVGFEKEVGKSQNHEAVFLTQLPSFISQSKRTWLFSCWRKKDSKLIIFGSYHNNPKKIQAGVISPNFTAAWGKKHFLLVKRSVFNIPTQWTVIECMEQLLAGGAR